MNGRSESLADGQSSGPVQGVFLRLEVPFWNRAEHIAIYRTRRSHRPVKGTQLDLFNPDDGYWEYSVVATNKDLGLLALWHFMNGHGVHEKTLAELKSGFADSLVLAQRQATYPITKTIYELFQLLGEGRQVAAALRVWAMLFLMTVVWFVSAALKGKLANVFRA